MSNEMPPKLESQVKEAPESAQTESKPASAHQSFIKELATSVVYSAVEQPALGLSQGISNDAMNSVKDKFAAVGVEAPTQEKFLSSGWYAQTFGGAIGTGLAVLGTKFVLGKLGVFGKAASAESGLLTSRTAVGMSIKESAITGMAYGTLFTPSAETTRNAGVGAFLLDRGVSGVGSAATFSAMTGASLGLGKLSKNAFVKDIGLAPIVGNKVVVGALSGLPGGFVSSEYESLVKSPKHTIASVPELTQSMVGMAIVGGTFSTASLFKRADVLPVDKGNSGGNDGNGRSADQNGRTADGNGRTTDGKGRSGTTNDGTLAKTAAAPDIVHPTGETPSEAHTDGARPVESDTALAAPLEAPKTINPNEFRPPSWDHSTRLELTTEEQDVWRNIQQAKTPAQWQHINAQIEEMPTDRDSWFRETLEHQSQKMSDAELGALWPQLLETNKHQGYAVAKLVGPERTTKMWQEQMASVKESGNPKLATELTNTMVYIEPGKQLAALKELLQLPKTPPEVDGASRALAPENQIPAAKMLAEKGIVPQIETSRIPTADWANWILDLNPGKIRDELLKQVQNKVVNAGKNGPQVLNVVYKLAQDRVQPGEYPLFNKMLSAIMPKNDVADGGASIRATALENVDPKFISRMNFHESAWPKSDQLADQNPELIKALAVNSKFSDSPGRNEYITSLMTARPPVTAEGLSESIMEQARTAPERTEGYLLSTGDITALVEHGVKVAPEQVPPLLSKIKSEVISTLDLRGNDPISRGRLATNLTLANELGKYNPAAFETGFKEPVEAALADQNYSYGRRLEAAITLGELQRSGYDGASAVRMPELRMGKLVDLAPEEQSKLRRSVEQSLYSRDAIKAQLGDGSLGRLLPSIFGDTTEGGIVGRIQHSTHDFTLDNHVLDVVDKIGKDPEFGKLLPKDQVDVLWAGLLHDVAKRENLMDYDHNWTSTSMTWGILRTLGYPDSRILRITDVMSKDADLSYEPNNKNSTKLSNPKVLDNVVNNYRHEDALNMVAILNRADIKSVKANEAWWKPEVASELDKIQEMARARVQELNKHLLPILPSELPQGFGAHELSDYTVLGHSSNDLGLVLKQRSTIESPEYSMSVSLLTPENRRVYTDGAQQIALLNGPFEHIAQANRANLSTGKSVGWDKHVELVDRWSTDDRAKKIAAEAESALANIGIPAARNVPAESFPRLAQLRKILGQFDSFDELRKAAGDDDPYVRASQAITQIMTTDRDGSPLKTNNEIKLNNPLLSGIGLLRNNNQQIFFEGITQPELEQIWHGNVPDFVSAGPAATAPKGALVVSPELVQSAKKNNLPIIVLNGNSN
jgi:hypothetical protein